MARTIRFFRCTCGKLHTATLIGPASKCSSCGRNLRSLVGWINASPAIKYGKS